MSIFKKLLISGLSSLLALAPLKAQELSFHIGDMLGKQNYDRIGESLGGINITLEDLVRNEIIAELTTDENGNARYNFMSVIQPNFRFNANNLQQLVLYNLLSQRVSTTYAPFDIRRSLQSIVNQHSLSTGIYFYHAFDDRGNLYRGRLINIEREIEGLTLPTDSKARKYSKRTFSTDEPRTIRLVVSDPDTSYFRFIDTLNVNDNRNYELNLDLFPNIELEWPENYPEERRFYRNFLHFLKDILWSTDEDVRMIAERTGRRWQHVRWPRFPIELFPNDRQAPNEHYRNSIREFRDDVSDITYGGYSHRFVTLVDAVPDSGGRYDFSHDASHWNVFERWRVIGGDSLIVPVNGIIYINNNVSGDGIRSAVYHESENFLVIGRDSANPKDIQNAGGPYPIELSNNDKLLLISIKNMHPHYRKLLNHRE